eukprot:TRINITY_DN5202_c0_g4_i2.p1 TRINITY_DN5202_c0_g4~~TRINITY_DN5202_c0_g4_i2.p1  ORF type:complete len:1225 (+),score=354.91 TRINITY_DN5202_c0_g4_i2:133-3807(+)
MRVVVIAVALLLVACTLVPCAFSTTTTALQRKTLSTDPINVFVIPHSHCDPGWLETYTGYYETRVREILNNVLSELQKDVKRKFVWAEISFFHLWYDKLSDKKKKDFKQIIDNGQWEFVEGGWVQADEANPNYDDVINHISVGHDYLLKTFGIRPKVGWQIDPFGHSSLTPTLFSRMGFDAMVINRIHYSLKSAFRNDKSMEFIWRGSPSVGAKSDIFTHVLHTHYSAPRGFDWEEGAQTISDRNKDSMASRFISDMKSKSHAYPTKNLLITFGDDFKFRNAGRQFSNMDKVIEAVNEANDGVHVQYGTVSDYFKAVHDSHQTFPLYSGDFFPYADNSDSYWTGYYTTRPVLKGLTRGVDSILRSADLMYAMSRVEVPTKHYAIEASWTKMYHQLQQARRDAALVMHHDGITGTAKSFVVSDYMERLRSAFSTCEQVIKNTAAIIMSREAQKPLLYPGADTFQYRISPDQVHPILLQNSLAWTRHEYVTIIVSAANARVLDGEGNDVEAQVTSVWNSSPNSDPTEPQLGKMQLTFRATVPPLGIATYFVTASRANDPVSRTSPTSVSVYVLSTKRLNGAELKSGAPTKGGVHTVKLLSSATPEELFISNKFVRLSFSPKTGMMESMTLARTNKTLSVKQNFFQYHTSNSGAYLFRTMGAAKVVECVDMHFHLRLIRGLVFDEAHIQCHSQVEIHLRLYHDKQRDLASFVEVNYRVMVERNRELVTRFSTKIRTGDAFYTDNGMEVLRRTRPSGVERAEQNYYPMPTTALLRGELLEFIVLSKQAGGVTSLGSGEIEVMLHRHLSRDDGRGLGEAVTDSTTHLTSHRIALESPELLEEHRRVWSLQLNNPLFILRGDTQQSVSEWTRLYPTKFTPLEQDFPSNLHVVSLQARDATSDDVVLRVLHPYEANQHTALSRPVGVSVHEILSRYEVKEARHVSLTANQDVTTSNSERLMFLQSGEQLTVDPLHHTSGVKPIENQNTAEEGVFISKDALNNALGQQSVNQQMNIVEMEDDLLAQDGEGRRWKRTFLTHDDTNAASTALTRTPMRTPARQLLQVSGGFPTSQFEALLGPLDIVTWIISFRLPADQHYHERIHKDHLGGTFGSHSGGVDVETKVNNSANFIGRVETYVDNNNNVGVEEVKQQELENANVNQPQQPAPKVVPLTELVEPSGSNFGFWLFVFVLLVVAVFMFVRQMKKRGGRGSRGFGVGKHSASNKERRELFP